MIIGYFQQASNQKKSNFIIVVKEPWNATHNFDNEDCSADDLVPAGFYTLDLCYFEHDFYNNELAKEALLNAGFVEEQLCPN